MDIQFLQSVQSAMTLGIPAFCVCLGLLFTTSDFCKNMLAKATVVVLDLAGDAMEFLVVLILEMAREGAIEKARERMENTNNSRIKDEDWLELL
jgi:CTP synthase (UTP-ammonia lyase)